MAVPYIFRKYKTSRQNHTQCWSPGDVIDTNTFDVENIVFSKGSSKAGTSIPSPFARLELFDTAFKIVAADQSKNDNLDGKSIYHQLVSDCLDVFQLLFNAKNADIGIGKKISFREWRVRENIDNLKSKGDQHPHALLARSLEHVFFDKIESAFTHTDSLFLIYYENRLLGGTSPLTLFFTSPNWSRYVQDGNIVNIPQSADGDIFFDDSYRPLYLRDPEFVQYVYKLFVQNPDSFAHADGMRAYINKTVERHFPNFRTELEKYRRSTRPAVSENDDYSAQRNPMEEEYTRLRTNVDNKDLTINGLFIYHQQEGREKARVEKTSDFKIRASSKKYQEQYNDKGELQFIPPPLVLKNNMNLSGDYMEKGVPWKPETIIKDFYHRSIPLFERKLPQGNALTITYPFITVEDFLEDVLLEMPYTLNRPKFFTGFSGEFKYLLPVKKEYFNFFSVADLRNALTITMSDGVVKVDLKIPIINKKGVHDITFIKQYSKEKATIIECKAGVGIFPFYQATGELSGLSYLNDYKILLANRIETDHAQQKLSLHFFSYAGLVSDSLALPSSSVPRSIQNRGWAPATSRFYSVKQLFDYIELQYRFDDVRPACAGLIIPDFENRKYTGGNKEFTFAIDFGTSNTHVAYSQKEEPFPKPFEIEESDQQMVLLNAPGNETDVGVKYHSYLIDGTLKREFLPAIIKNSSKEGISFPVKTASCEVESFHNIIDKSVIDLFSHINIGYYLEKEESPSSDIYTTDLKWLLENEGSSLSNQNRVKFFLKQLLLQIKVKTILNNGRLSKLKVVWSIPLSMSSGNRSALEKILGTAFNDVFNNGDNSGATLMEPIPESVAPYFYLTQSPNGIKDTANAINIDIGGGTTDIMMFMESSGKRTDKYLTTSFRFAGNDLWGWGYKGKSKDNGFIENYARYRNSNNINPEVETRYLRKVEADGNLKADDMVSLLFKYDEKFRFSDSITMGNPDLSLVLYLHYSAIIYHLLQVIELREYPLPRYLSFTGKGSQYIRLICGGSERSLREFTALLIKTYTGKDVQSWFSIHLNSNPKEITANGSVLYAQTIPEERDKYKDRLHFIHPGFHPGKDLQFTDKASADGIMPVILKNILEINSPLNIAVLNNLNDFLDKTLAERNIIDFLGGYKIRNLKESLQLLRWNGDIENGEGLIYDSYRKVLNGLRNEQKDHDTKLPESLFFFAFKDALYHLSKEIMSNKTV